MTASASNLSRFTPSLMSHELLERLFVVRERTLDAILARVDAAASTPERNHTLLIGPRGAGKTHLVALAYHRINDRRKAGATLQVAWLPEDPWTIVSYRHLLAAIADRVEPEIEEEIPRSAEELESLLTARSAADGPIVVLVENLDQILHALGDEGQQRLRHLLQADRSLLLVATSTRLDRTLSDQASPFYGFFTTTRLEPFDVDEAANMLTAIAEERDDERLAAYLNGEEGRARLRTIEHLAGGQPRMWAALAGALTVSRLNDLIDLLLTRFDDLTPYYQEQLGRLSGHQRLVVAELAAVDRPIHVNELAVRLGIDQRSLGKTMSELVDRGWAAPTKSPVTKLLDQRRTYYELAEPLARLSFQIKDSRGKPLRLVVEFLKHWFDPTDLNTSDAPGIVGEYLLLATRGHDSDSVVAVTRLLSGFPETRAPTEPLLGKIDDALAALVDGDPGPFICLPSSVRTALESQIDPCDLIHVRIDIHRAAQAELGHPPESGIEPWIARAESLIATSDAAGTTAAQLLLADWLGRAWRFDEATEVLDAAAALLGDGHRNTLTARANLAASYWRAGRTTEAIAHGERVVADLERVLGEQHPNTLTARANLAGSYWQAGRTNAAISIEERVADDRARLLGDEHPDTLTARANLATSYLQAGRTNAAITIEERVADDRARLLGERHSDTLVSRSNLATSYLQAGRTNAAIAILERVVADSERLLGAEHTNTLTARSNLGGSYWQAGRRAEAITIGERVLADSERLLGAEHPLTVAARANLAGVVDLFERLGEAGGQPGSAG